MYMILPVLILVGGAIGFMIWTGDGDIREGDGARSILWAVILATAISFIFLVATKRAKGEVLDIGFKGMGDLLPAVTVIFLALVLGSSLGALGTGAFIAKIASGIPAPWAIPAILFIAAGVTSFTTGTSWGTYGILVPIAVPLALGAGIPLPLAVAAVIGGGVFGDHCSPISDTTIMSSMSSAADHVDHVRTQAPYAAVCAVVAILFGFLPAGYGISPMISLPLGIAAVIAIVRFVGRLPEVEAEAEAEAEASGVGATIESESAAAADVT